MSEEGGSYDPKATGSLGSWQGYLFEMTVTSRIDSLTSTYVCTVFRETEVFVDRGLRNRFTTGLHQRELGQQISDGPPFPSTIIFLLHYMHPNRAMFLFYPQTIYLQSQHRSKMDICKNA